MTRRRHFGPAVLLLLLGVVFSEAASATRIVAIGDIHGSYDGLSQILQETGLIDQSGHWIGGSTILVQTGDFLDRGVQLREVMGLLRSLQREAPAQGGKVMVLLGNHEGMNLLGITRDVSPDAYAQFVDDESEQRRERSYRTYMKWARLRSKRIGEQRPVFTSDFKRRWMDRYPLGYLEYLEALAPKSEIGAWLRTLPTVARVEDKVFLHGGIPPSLASWSEERINERVHQEITDLDACRAQLLEFGVIHETSDPSAMVTYGQEELDSLLARIPKAQEPLRHQLAERARTLRDCVDYRDWFLVKEDGPLWFRGFARWQPEEGEALIGPLLQARGASHFIVGHSVQAQGRIKMRFDGRVFLIDTGMLSSHYTGGRASALEIDSGRFTAIYPGEREVLYEKTAAESMEATAAASLLTTFNLALQAPAAAESFVSLPQERRWLDPEGQPLPFTHVDELLDFLRTADVVKAKRTKQGINQPFKVTLERNGVRSHAVFRTVDIKEERYRMPSSGRFFTVFRDNHAHEVAAYELSRMLGMSNVPPAVERAYRGEVGSMQLWIENVIDEKTRIDEGIDPPGLWWVQMKTLTRVFDALIANIDRNAGNTLLDRNHWALWLIDHGRSFFEFEELEHEYMLTQIEHGLWKRLREADRQEVERRLDPYLSDPQLTFLFRRWDRLIEHYERRIADLGEGAVLFHAVAPPAGG